MKQFFLEFVLQFISFFNIFELHNKKKLLFNESFKHFKIELKLKIPTKKFG